MYWMFGLPDGARIEQLELALDATWAQEYSAVLFYLLVLLFALGFYFYFRLQPQLPRATRIGLGLLRGATLSMLLVTLANPILRIVSATPELPIVHVVFDGSESMAIEDAYRPDEQVNSIGTSSDVGTTSENGSQPRSRLERVRTMLASDQANPFRQLAERSQAELRFYSFEGQSTSRLRHIGTVTNAEQWELLHLSDRLTAQGGVTAIGAALDEIGQQPGASRVAGVVMISDFGHNSGIPPIGAPGAASPATRLRVPIHTVGVGAVQATDLVVELQTDVRMKRAERSAIVARLRQSGLEGKSANVRLVVRPLQSKNATGSTESIVGERTVELSPIGAVVEFPYVPQEAGPFEFAVRADLLPGESIAENNQATRRVNIIDDYLRLMYVSFEPTWEWRFIKEVFHRDKLVGMDGFRTFLSSSDPRVRQANVLFLPSLTPQRSAFFANDVLFLGDMPRNSLTPRFQELVQEFVSQLGGGLVVICGPRFGLKELMGTPLAEMLPVVFDGNLGLRDGRPFRPQRTAHADRYPFMKLGSTPSENDKAWSNLGELPWYQPVAALHPQAFVLAEHPSDKCADGKTPQPILAVRQYGRGEVVYLAFDEMWRLRRKYGELYYRQFWSQLIYRLGMSHALGSAKRFVVSLDQQEYRVDDQATLSVEAYNLDYEPLKEQDLPGGKLLSEVIALGSLSGQETQNITLSMRRPGVFEASLPLTSEGIFAIRVKDPIADRWEERRVEARSTSAERRRPMRDLQLQQALARDTGGRSYELSEIGGLADDLNPEPIIRTSIRHQPLWSTPAWFAVVVGMLLMEWLTRKMVRLA